MSEISNKKRKSLFYCFKKFTCGTTVFGDMNKSKDVMVSGCPLASMRHVGHKILEKKFKLLLFTTRLLNKIKSATF